MGGKYTEAQKKATAKYQKENQENEYLFIQNYARETKAVPVPSEYEVIYGTADEIMQPLATRVLKKKK